MHVSLIFISQDLLIDTLCCSDFPKLMSHPRGILQKFLQHVCVTIFKDSEQHSLQLSGISKCVHWNGFLGIVTCLGTFAMVVSGNYFLAKSFTIPVLIQSLIFLSINNLSTIKWYCVKFWSTGETKPIFVLIKRKIVMHFGLKVSKFQSFEYYRLSPWWHPLGCYKVGWYKKFLT